MTRHRLAAACVAAVLGIASSAAPAASAAAAPPVNAAAYREFTDGFVGWAAKILAVPTTPDIDAPLRDAMSQLVNEHLVRLRKLLPAWIADERARAAKPLTNDALGRAIRNRFFNEIALWRLESPGADYDAVLTRAILRPGVCKRPARDSYMGALMAWMQAVPPAGRATLLAGERTLFSHWGQPRNALPARPAKSLGDDENDTIVQLRSGAAAPDVAMPPMVANSVFKGEIESQGDDFNCALHQWGLAHALHRGDAPATALAAWRYTMLRTSAGWSNPPPSAAAADATTYPWAAASAGASAVIEVRVTPDAQGHFGSGRIAGRHLTVPGVVDNPPVAFETLFDAASLAQAARQFKPAPAPADATPPKPVMMHIDWTLQ